MRSLDASRRFGVCLGGIVVLAAVLRVCGLGRVSPWLDEVLTLGFAARPFPELLATCARDADNVPVYALLTRLSLLAGLEEPWLRLFPVAAGLGSIVLMAVWVRGMAGEGPALFAAAFCAMSPFHVRYSQELRAYPYLLVVVAAALLATDRVRRRPDGLGTVALGGVVGLGLWTHLTFVIAIPMLVALVLRSGAGSLRRRLAAVTAALAIGAALFAPWAVAMAPHFVGRIDRGGGTWSLELLAQRWQFLTAGSREGESLGVVGVTLLLVAAVGLIALRRWPDLRVTVVTALVACLGWEAALFAGGHWSSGRYDSAVWLLLAAVVGVGVHRLATGPTPLFALLGAGAVAAGLLVAVDRYHRDGRPDWQRVAAVVDAVVRPNEPVLAENEWSMISLQHALSARGSSVRLAVLSEPLEIPPMAPRSDTTLVVLGGWPHTDLRNRLRPLPRLHADRTTASVVRVPASDETNASWPPVLADLVPWEIRQPRLGCIERMLAPPRAPAGPRIDLETSDRWVLVSGWSRPFQTAAGLTLAHVVGTEAALSFAPLDEAPQLLRARVWSVPHLERQRMRILVNGVALGECPLAARPSILAFDIPAGAWRDGENLVVLQLAEAMAPASSVPGSSDTRPLSAVCDWIEVTASPSAAEASFLPREPCSPP